MNHKVILEKIQSLKNENEPSFKSAKKHEPFAANYFKGYFDALNEIEKFIIVDETDNKLVFELLNFALEIGITLEMYKPGDRDNDQFEQWLIDNSDWVDTVRADAMRTKEVS